MYPICICFWQKSFYWQFQKILKFRQTELDEFCFEGRTLNIHLVENEDYSPKDKPSDVYDFRFALNPNCSRNPDEFICKCTLFYILIMLFDFLLLALRLLIIMALTNYIVDILLGFIRSCKFSNQHNINNHVLNL